MAEPSKTEQRKAEHVNIILQENVSAEYNYWNDVKLVHRALPEIDLDDVDVGVKFLGKKLEAPLIISSMTGGFGMGKEINANLAKGAAEVGVAMGVGSQRAALEKPDLAPTYAVVKDFGVPLVFANLGAPQLVPQAGKRAYGVADAKKAVDMIDADALIVHLNFLQEVVQPEGGRDPEGAPRRDVLELGDPDPRLDSVGRCRTATRRHGRRAERPRCRPRNRPRRNDGGHGEADARSREGLRGRGGGGTPRRHRGTQGRHVLDRIPIDRGAPGSSSYHQPSDRELARGRRDVSPWRRSNRRTRRRDSSRS